MNPIDVIATELRAPHAAGVHTTRLAEVAANALTDERIVANAAQALLDDAKTHGYASASGGVVYGQDPAKIVEVARIVLRSVGTA